ncbi:uncharacterized protein LOC125239383 isoform X2 [Leguminivora glycinivorella]|uniref:uncharacterized protein LOC125239383 isoform X1 n=1 Tax=Leguminivora glycinivorella TaxID=1035111 RepID=UPI00200EB2E5|nr:uncharacterized protein LOC125239383 isoform X1 [Leguminivora glycinivorella]XP_048002908.1 uncharacterized protein LOC125239383 isoform X2 [Leguminivora glycinivorella]
MWRGVRQACQTIEAHTSKSVLNPRLIACVQAGESAPPNAPLRVSTQAQYKDDRYLTLSLTPRATGSAARTDAILRFRMYSLNLAAVAACERYSRIHRTAQNLLEEVLLVLYCDLGLTLREQNISNIFANFS